MAVKHPAPKPKRQTDLIVVTRLGHTFKASRRTVAWLDYLIFEFARLYPKARLVILQTCYNTGVEASAHTHDYDAAFDFTWAGTMPGLTKRAKWLRFQGFFRNHQSGGWWRHTSIWARESAWHFHGFPLPVGLELFSTVVGLFIDGGESLRRAGQRAVVASSQLVDYLTGKDGTADHAPDRTWRPKKITPFNYNRWVKAHGIPLGKGEKA